MTTKQSRWREAVSYTRVSTEGQRRHGIGLEGQMVAITTYAEIERFRIVDSFQDVGTGRGEHNLVDRPGLSQALESARATGRPILVSGLDRVSRHRPTLEQIVMDRKVTIISALDGEIRSAALLASRAAQAQFQGDQISNTTRRALAIKKAEGVLLGNRSNLGEAQRRGVQRKKEIAEQKVQEIASVLKDLIPEKSTRELVDILNGRGIRTTRNLPWTAAALRRHLRKARILVTNESQKVDTSTYAQNPLFGMF